MIDIEHDIGAVHLHCRFSRPSQLVELLEKRATGFITLIEKIGEKTGNQVMWTNQHGGTVVEPNIDLSSVGCEKLAKEILDRKDFDFFAWTPWEDDIYPSISFGRKLIQDKDKTHINFKFPNYYFIKELDLQLFINSLLDFGRQKDIGFTTQVRLKTDRNEPPFAYEGFNIYHHSNNRQFSNMGVEDQLNPDFPEDTYIDPLKLGNEYLPKFREDLN